jgi:hypothetical protein
VKKQGSPRLFKIRPIVDDVYDEGAQNPALRTGRTDFGLKI